MELDKNYELIISHIYCYLEFSGQLDIHHSNEKFKIKREDSDNLIDRFNHDYIVNYASLKSRKNLPQIVYSKPYWSNILYHEEVYEGRDGHFCLLF